MVNTHSKAQLRKGALINGIINAVINGVINYFSLNRNEPVYLTQDSISGNMHTVFAGAVPLAVSLAFILTTVGYFTVKKSDKIPYFPKVFIIALKHSAYAFGLVAIAGLLIQRFLGQVEVTHLLAAIIAGIIAGIVAALVDYETKKAI